MFFNPNQLCSSGWIFNELTVNQSSLLVMSPPEYVTHTNTHSSIVDGQWSTWTPWGQCSVSCGTGLRSRYHFCTSPHRSGSGLPCLGPHRDDQVCITTPCDREFSLYNMWQQTPCFILSCFMNSSLSQLSWKLCHLNQECTRLTFGLLDWTESTTFKYWSNELIQSCIKILRPYIFLLFVVFFFHFSMFKSSNKG